MNIDIQKLPVQLKMQDCERVFVLHHKIFIGIFNGFGDDRAPDIPAIDKIVFVIPVSSGNDRFPDITGQRSKSCLPMDLQQICRDLSSIDPINDILQICVSGGMQPVLIIIDKFERNLRMRKSQPFHQVIDVTGFRLRTFQEFPPDRCIIEHIPHLKSGALRCADFFRLRCLLFSAFNDITDTGEFSRCLCNQFHLADSCNTGKCLSTKPQRRDTEKILRFHDLAGRMAHKRFFYLCRCNAFSVVCDPHKSGPAVFDLYGHRIGACIDGVLHQLLYDRRRPLDHFACCDLVNGVFVQYRNCFHELPHLFLSRFCSR